MNDYHDVNPLPTDTPWFPDVTILAMVPDDWCAPFQPRHYVLSRLSRYFNVIWHTAASDWHEVFHTHVNRVCPDNAKTDGRVAPGLEIYKNPKALPVIHSPKRLARLFERLRIMQVQARLKRAKAQKTILYVWRPEFKWALDKFSYDLLCYHIDDEYTWSTEAVPIQPDEKTLLDEADQVIIHSPGLFEEKGRINPHTALIPNGVAFDMYNRPWPEPAILADVPRPRIGYSGYVKSQLDLDLLLELALTHPEWSFVFVGPKRISEPDEATAARMFALSNVHDLGLQHPNCLPALVQHFDVCTMCYRMNDYTKCIYPLKLHEYLATGRPVIGTPINSLLQHADLLTLASTRSEWSAGIANLLADVQTDNILRERRQELARAHDWDKLVHRLAHILARRLGSSYFQRFNRATDGFDDNSFCDDAQHQLRPSQSCG